MCLVLGLRHPAVSYLKHVRVVEAARSRRRGVEEVEIEDPHHGRPVVPDVVGHAPLVGRDRAPRPGLLDRDVVARAQDDRASGHGDRVPPARVEVLHHQAVGAAAVRLDVVHAPRSEGGHVLDFMVQAPRAHVAAHAGADRSVEAEPEAAGVDVVPEGLHAGGEGLRIVREVSRRISVPRGPARVERHDIVSGRLEAAVDHRVRDLLDQGLIDAAGKMIPAVPAHRRQGPDRRIPDRGRPRGGRNGTGRTASLAPTREPWDEERRKGHSQEDDPETQELETMTLHRAPHLCRGAVTEGLA